jgi:N-methylhydantoinase A
MASAFGFGGVDVRVPCIDVRSIGAGGGSIANVEFGELAVGPQSAGATPGPACYGRGGSRPTGTDADLVLGVLDPAGFAGGDMPLDREAAEQAIREHVAEPLGVGVVEAAWGIRQVLDSRMADLLRQVTIERGHDPRTFTMFANGGSGPSHGWVLSRELGMDEFVVPATATVQSALGAGTSAVKISAERTVHVRLPPDGTATDAHLEELAAALEGATGEATETPVGAADAGDAELEATAAIRFRGQSQHLDIPITAGDLDPARFTGFVERFEREYESLFGEGAGFRLAGYEVLSIRVIATRPLSAAAAPPLGDPLVHVGTRDVWFDDPHRPEKTDVYTVEHPADGQRVDGPCLIEFSGQTVVVPPGSTAVSDALGNLIVRTS